MMNGEEFYRHFKSNLSNYNIPWAEKKMMCVSIKDNKLYFHSRGSVFELDINANSSKYLGTVGVKSEKKARFKDPVFLNSIGIILLTAAQAITLLYLHFFCCK